LAREVSLEEIIKIRKNVPKHIKIEAFVHGAMCMSISGRCHLSNYLTGHDANRGACAQVCRWGFAVSEEKRAGQYMPLEQDEKYSYIFNAKDLNMIKHLDKLAAAGIDSFKVEGRNKSIYYCAIVTRAYRKAIDLLYHSDSPAGEEGSHKNKILHSAQNDSLKEIAKELSTVSSRGYSTGFYFGKPNNDATNYKTSRAQSEWDFVAIIKNKLSDHQFLAEGRGEIFPGNRIEIVTPDKIIKMKLKELISPKGIRLEKVNPSYEFIITSEENIPVNSMIRIKTDNKKQPI
jgi:putative protease